MKLISYHIENYGKIHNQDGRFEEGLTEFCEKNGFGKTTMASFIRAMFYGLPSYTAKTKAFDDRQRFYPFSGGKFGGNITFEMQGNLYKIERFFGKKSNKDDEVTVYCNNAPFLGFGEDIGKEVFGLDEESFKKTVFITADEIEIESTHSINEKLNRDVQGADGDFERALETLEKARKQLKAGRGNNDLISEKKAEILTLTARIKNLNDVSDGLAEEYQERESLSKKIAEGEFRLKEENSRALLLQKWETYDNLSTQTAQKKAALQAYLEKYPQGAPSEEERATLTACAQEEARLMGALQTTAFGQEKAETLQQLRRKFANGVPMDGVIAEKQHQLTKRFTLQAELARKHNQEKSKAECILENKFSLRMPTETEFAEKREKVEEYKRKNAQLKELHATFASGATVGKGLPKWKILLFIFSAILCVGGVCLAALQQLAVGISLLTVSVVAFAVAMIFGKKAGAMAHTPMTEIAKIQSEIHLLEENIRAFTVPYGYYGEAGALHDFISLEEDVRAYKAALERGKNEQASMENLRMEIEGLETDLHRFLNAFGEDTVDLQNGLNRLISAVSTYRSLQEDEGMAKEKAEEARLRLDACQKTMGGILKKYALDAFAGTMDGLKGVEIDCKRMQELQSDIEILQENLANYQEKNGLTARPAGEINTEGLHVVLSDLRKRLADCDKRIAEAERLVERLPDEQNALECAEEKLEAYKAKYQLVADTEEALKAAEKALKDRYVAPIKEKFSYYAEALERVLDEKVTMDSDYHVKFERGGEERSDRHLSAGERSICALCLRLALIDNMYETEQPFIVMDDPFVHLDAEHMSRTAQLVSEIAKKKQIIYFCCHESRKVMR